MSRQEPLDKCEQNSSVTPPSEMEDTMDCRVIAVDQDPAAIERAMKLSRYPQYRDRLFPIHGKFGDLVPLIRKHLNVQAACLDGILFDIGVSSNQLDEANRGFSFRFAGPLDMRMGSRGDTDNLAPSLQGTLTAEAVVNNFPEHELADIIYKYSEERLSRRIARAIVAARENKPIVTTVELADIVSAATVGRRTMSPSDGYKHPAVRTFQALRIYVNDELAQLRSGLKAAEHLLLPGGNMVVVTFHSLEDRIAKQFLARCASPPPSTSSPDAGNEHLEREYQEMDALDLDLLRRRGADARSSDADLGKLQGRKRRERMERKRERQNKIIMEGREEDLWADHDEPSFKIITRRTVLPTQEEVIGNPRARSAKLRAAQRTNAPPLSRF
ncbi:hypothetical protein PhCBS80983_g03106 [Powellomyces hirtus]|uniref:16S rRNA (Cytosine(1402)-N(4))-methyltransferase n=1 Tax=Powellomyces hirtus TaxID=109895 RepID=A0A507E358_9FUNG|nr:hypothetical protein PhCBS80983_g03106 [Powellomyces hirtus]